MRQRIEEARLRDKPPRIDKRWVSLSTIPKHVIDAIIVAEDGTFYSHSGIDWYEVQESIEKNLKVGRAARGASTITQQLAKNLYLSTSKTPMRKLKEFVITKLLETNLSKGRILEIYLNVIEWGDGLFGIEAAAQTYFGKSVRELTLDEATRIAAVIPSPLRYKPNVDSRYVTLRRQIVLQRMMARNFAKEPWVEGETQGVAPELETMPYEALPIPEFEDSLDFIDSTYIDEGRSNGL